MLCVFLVFSVAEIVAGLRKGADDYIGLDSTETLPVCAPSIVEETCQLFQRGGDAPTTIVHGKELQTSLSATDDAIVNLWQTLNLNETYFSVSCASLCDSLKNYLHDNGELPPASDVGCYEAGPNMICDLDLSPDRVGHLVGPPIESMPDIHDRQFLERHPEGSESKKAARTLEVAAKKIGDGFEKPRKSTKPYIKYQPRFLVHRIANFFRIYPTPSTKISLDTPSLNALVQVEESSSNVINSNDLEELEHWRTDVRKRNMEAQAYVSTAIRKFNARKTKRFITKWFGDTAFTDINIRNEVSRVLNSVANMLNDVEYVYPGENCAKDSYAYVYPYGKLSKDEDGKFIFHLCELHMQSDRGVQIETLTHEGSHHATSFTNDVCMDEYFNGPMPVYEHIKISELNPDGVALGEWYTLFKEPQNNGDEVRKIPEYEAKAVWQDGYNTGHNEGYDSGYRHGEEDGYNTGHNEGYDDGYDDGFEVGEEDGYKTGHKKGYKSGYRHGQKQSFLEDDMGHDAMDDDRQEHPAEVVFIYDDTAILEVDPPSDCKNTAYGRRDCEYLARNNPVKAIRNADNFCYYIQDITDDETGA